MNNKISNLIVTAINYTEDFVSSAWNGIRQVSIETGFNLVDALPSSWVPSRPEYTYLDPATRKGREVLIVGKKSGLQRRVNQAFRGIKREEPLVCFVKNRIMEKKAQGQSDQTIIHKSNPFIFEDPVFPGFVLKAKGERNTWKFSVHALCPGNVVGRVSMAHTMRQIVDRENYDQLYVPKKVLAHIPNAPRKLDDANYLALAEKLDLTSDKETEENFKNMAQNEIEELLTQLYSLILKSGYTDGHKWNFAFIKSGPNQGKLAIYDTEPLATFDYRNYVSNGQNFEEGPPPESYSKAREKDHVIAGTTGMHDLRCAEQAINDTLAVERGLPIPDKIKRPIAEKFLKQIKEELQSNTTKQNGVFYSPIYIAMTGIAIQCITLGLDYVLGAVG